MRKRTLARSEPRSGEERERADRMLLRDAAMTFQCLSLYFSLSLGRRLTGEHRVSWTLGAYV